MNMSEQLLKDSNCWFLWGEILPTVPGKVTSCSAGEKALVQGGLLQFICLQEFLSQNHQESAGLASHGSKLNTLSPGRWQGQGAPLVNIAICQLPYIAYGQPDAQSCFMHQRFCVLQLLLKSLPRHHNHITAQIQVAKALLARDKFSVHSWFPDYFIWPTPSSLP